MKRAYMRPSALPDTTPVPSALKAAAVTGSECDAIVRRHLPVATSQILTFSSKDPLTYVRPAIIEASLISAGLRGMHDSTATHQRGATLHARQHCCNHQRGAAWHA